MKLIHKPTGNEIKEGSSFLWEGRLITVNSCHKPHKPSSSGKMTVIYPEGATSQEYFCPVFDCEWIEREDRQEQDDLLERAKQNTPMTVKLQPALPAGESQKALSRVNQSDQIAKLEKKIEDVLDYVQNYSDGSSDANEVGKFAYIIEGLLID